MNIRKYLSNMNDVDDMLALMGLQKRSSSDWVFPMLAGVGAGMAIGAGLALFLTPYKGEEIREKVRQGATDAQRMLNERMEMISEKIGITEKKEAGTMTSGGVSTSRTMGVGGVGSTGGSVGGNRGY
ncbi:MAG: YtxH domain-containing protein [Deltaproteobacteria bacterium]|nr:YtxH domain-containing protein [Deltaproteobacteria bacterium]